MWRCVGFVFRFQKCCTMLLIRGMGSDCLPSRRVGRECGGGSDSGQVDACAASVTRVVSGVESDCAGRGGLVCVIGTLLSALGL